ncbi:hypothetical protein POM88_046652 [Heracleum sosnowskyi]|uniref:P-type ATPase A domain-containing protein n=1 Tax=Heracleum sosnowskyi TaxID=360622 RepID=A0AAD8M7N2_9APIA|nr:hypothetical protein POM88_046652 [Heracleum sosnowskyi]
MSVGAQGFAEGSFSGEKMHALRHFLGHAVLLWRCAVLSKFFLFDYILYLIRGSKREEDPLKIDQSSLTGEESLPVTKNLGDEVYSGSTCVDNLLVFLIAMPTVISVTMTIGSHRLSQQEMTGMDVLGSDKTGTLTLNKLTVDKNLVEGKVSFQS